jgi:hypothetical protein
VVIPAARMSPLHASGECIGEVVGARIPLACATRIVGESVAVTATGGISTKYAPVDK